MEKTTFTKLFTPFDNQADARFAQLRQSGRECFGAAALPTTRTEDWRFTNISPITATPFTLANNVHARVKLDSDHPTVLFVNGRFAKQAPESIGASAEIGSLARATTKLSQLARIASDRDSPFTCLNTSFLNDGAYVVVPDGNVIATPIEIRFHSLVEGNAPAIHPRTLVVVGKNACVTIVERYSGNAAYFTNAVTEIAVGEGAVVDHVKIQDESTTAYHIAHTAVVMGARSNFTTHYVSLGGALVRNEVRVRFDGEHAEATVNGLYLASGTQHIDNFTLIDHAQPNCASHELYKGILDGKSHGVFNGKIFVRKDAQKTDAKQTNKVLLLSDDATINTKPQLEIFADDVKCTHGATVGQLDPLQLFYLQSRGIPLDQARRLLTFAFANDIVGRLKIEALRDELEQRIVR